jgi:hypothetical protein
MSGQADWASQGADDQPARPWGARYENERDPLVVVGIDRVGPELDDGIAVGSRIEDVLQRQRGGRQQGPGQSGPTGGGSPWLVTGASTGPVQRRERVLVVELLEVGRIGIGHKVKATTP